MSCGHVPFWFGWSLSLQYAVLVGGANGDGAWRGMVMIVETIDPHSYIFSLPDLGG